MSAAGGRASWRRRLDETAARCGAFAPVVEALGEVVERLRGGGEVDVARLRTLVYALATLGRVVEVATVAPELEALAARLAALEGKS